MKRIVLISIAFAVVVSALCAVSAADANSTGDVAAVDESDSQVLVLDNTSQELQSSPETVGENVICADMDRTTYMQENGSDSKSQDQCKIEIASQGKYFREKTVKVKLTDSSGNPLSGKRVVLKFSNGRTVTKYTKSDGLATYNVGFNAGKYTVTATFEGASASHDFEITKAPAKIKVKKRLSTYFGNKPLKITVTNKVTGKRINGVRLMVIVSNGKKTKKFYVKTQVKGTAYFWGSDLKAGKYRLKIKCDPSQASAKAKKSQLKIKKADGKIMLKKKSAKAGKYSQFIIKLKNTKTSKKISYAKVLIKVTNGKKTKTLTKKTNYYGRITLKTLKWPAGKYKFKIACRSSAVTAKPRKATLKII